MEVYVELLRPVNPTGRGFVTGLYAAIAAKDKELIDRYKKEISRNINRLGYKIEEVVGRGKLVSGTIVILVDDKTKEPKKIYVKNLKVWDVVKEVNENIGVEIP
ncbi:MAG: hypothetical protein ACO2ON_03795 [Candidatus Nanopusillus sp.]